MTNIEAAIEAMRRASDLLDATARFMTCNPIAAEYTVNYDEAQCDGWCLADDCRIAIEELACAAEWLKPEVQIEQAH